MGYDTYFWGSMTVEPQIPTHRWPGHGTGNPDLFSAEGMLVLRNEDGARDVGIKPDGTIGVIGEPGHTIIDVDLDEPTRGDIGEELAVCIQWVKGEGSVANGVVDAQGEESPDRHRYRIVDNVIHSERPKLVWPNGDEEPL